MDSSTPTLSYKVSSFVLKARRAFFKMTMREKVLALLFAFAIIFMWSSWQLDRHSALSDRHTAARRSENEQQNWLDLEAQLRATFQSQKEQIDIGSLPSKDEVSAQIDALARKANFSSPFDFGDPRTEEGTDMVFHTYQVIVSQETFPTIYNFTKAVKAELPYLSLDRIVIQAQDKNDSLLNVRYVFKSIEYTQ